MNRHVVAVVASVILLMAGATWLLWAIFTPSADLMDLTPEERRGYPQASSTVSSSSTATSTGSCAGLSVSDCPSDRWQTYAHPAGFSFKYPLPENLKSHGEILTVDLGYPEKMRVRVTVLPASLSFLTLGLSENELYRRYGGDKKSATVAGRRALSVSDSEDAEHGWLTYVELDASKTLFLFAEFTEDFETDQRLFGEILASFEFSN